MVVLRGKCIIVGDSTVGKSALTQSFHSDGTSYPKNYMMSTGVELLPKLLQLGENNSESVDLFLFDNAGKEVFKDMTEINWEKMGMYAVVFDVTNQQSFGNCQKWIKLLRPYFEPGKTIPGVLIGNKADLEQRRKITKEKAEEFATANSLVYFETSAKEYVGVDAPFRHLAEKFTESHKEMPSSIQELL